MANIENTLAFQIRFGAIPLPKMKSISFIKTGFGNGNVKDIAIVWLDHSTTEKLTAQELKDIEGHYSNWHPSAIDTATSLPSQRKSNAYVSYQDGQLYFINGLHRTRLHLEGGAPYIPFDISIESFIRLQRDGHAFAAFDVTYEYAKKQEDLREFDLMPDPFVAAYKKNFPNKMTLDAALDTSRLFFKLAAQEVSNLKRRLQLEEQTNYRVDDDRAHDLEEALTLFSGIKEMLPLIVKLKESGMKNWPEGVGFPILTPGFARPQAERIAEWKDNVIKATGIKL